MVRNPLQVNENAEIRKSYVPNPKQDEILRWVYQRLEDMKQARQPFEVIWDKAMKQYEALRPPKDLNDWQSNIVPPFTTSIIEAELSELIEQLKMPKVVARGEEDRSKSTIVNYVLKYLWEIGNADIEQYKVIKEALILGTAVGQNYYWKDQRKVQLLVKYDSEKGIEEFEEKTIADFDDDYFEYVSLWDFYIDESARSVNAGPYKANDCIRRYVLPLETFKQTYQGKIWDPYNAARFVVPGNDTNHYQYYKPPQGINKDEVEVLWYWSRNPDKLVIVANDVLIKEGPNPYNHKQLPFFQAVDIFRPNQFYHKGEPELLESIQDELTTIRRQRLDRTHLDTDKMFLVSNREQLTDQDLIVEPHKPIYVEDPTKSIVPLDYAQTPQTAYLEEDRLKEDGERVTGVDIRSLSVKSSGSATEAAILKEATLRRLRLKLWLIARTCLVEQTRLRVADIMQFYSKPKIQSIVGMKEAELKIAMEKGTMREINGEKFLEMPRTIRTTDVQLERQPTGTIIEKDRKGENYFDVRPEDVVPSKLGFDIKVAVDPTFPVSKPLLQEQVRELFASPLMEAAIANGIIDLKKSVDKVLEVNDFDPADFEPRKPEEDAINPEQMIEMAGLENEQMLKGVEVPGLGFANREHTDIHLAFMLSEEFANAFRQNPNLINIFTRHILDEEVAQQNRAKGVQAGGQPGQPGAQNTTQGVAASSAAAAQPGRAVGNTGISGQAPNQQ